MVTSAKPEEPRPLKRLGKCESFKKYPNQMTKFPSKKGHGDEQGKRKLYS